AGGGGRGRGPASRRLVSGLPEPGPRRPRVALQRRGLLPAGRSRVPPGPGAGGLSALPLRDRGLRRLRLRGALSKIGARGGGGVRGGPLGLFHGRRSAAELAGGRPRGRLASRSVG